MSKQLTLEQRYVISALLKRKVSISEIADEVGCHQSTIYNEIKRNACKDGHYSPVVAQEKTMERRERIVTNSALKPGVLERALKLLVEKRWSPQQISGFLRLEGVRISTERIYQEIRRRPELHRYCHHKMKYRHHKDKTPRTAGKSLIPNRVSIHDRPKEADGRRFGDWEMDLVIGKGQKSQVLTLYERSQSFFIQTKLSSKKPGDVAAAVIRLLIPYRKYVHTITTDNGIEFRDHESICKALNCVVYFADPYCSGQKGGVENINKIFREFYPKGTDFRLVEQSQMNKVQYLINERPRKKLGFSSPKKEFFKRFA